MLAALFSAAFLAFWVVLWFVMGALFGYLVGDSKGRPALGFWFGLLFGLVGVLAVGLMEPTDDVVRRRSGRGPGPLTAKNGEGGLEAEPSLTDLVAEVVRRDPTIADLDSPGAVGRLQTAVDALATERSLRAALAEAQRLEATRQAERERRLAEEQQRQLAKAEEERRRQEGEDEARREKEARAAHIAAMRPVPKWLATHPAAVSAVAIAAVFALAVWAVVATPAQESSSPAPTQARLTAAPAPPAGGPINSQTEWAPGFRGVYAELEASDDWSVSAAATATMFTWEVGTDCSGRAWSSPRKWCRSLILREAGFRRVVLLV